MRAYSIGALFVLACAVALDVSFTAHFRTQYPYGASVDVFDLAVILRGFTPADLQLATWPLLLTLALATATVTANWLSRRIAAWIRFVLAVLQLPIVLIGLVGGLVFLSTVTAILHGQLDGEWLDNGTPLLGALAIWSFVPATVFTRALGEMLGASRTRWREKTA